MSYYLRPFRRLKLMITIKMTLQTDLEKLIVKSDLIKASETNKNVEILQSCC